MINKATNRGGNEMHSGARQADSSPGAAARHSHSAKVHICSRRQVFLVPFILICPICFLVFLFLWLPTFFPKTSQIHHHPPHQTYGESSAKLSPLHSLDLSVSITLTLSPHLLLPVLSILSSLKFPKLVCSDREQRSVLTGPCG